MLLAVLGLSACGEVSNTFEVRVHDRAATRAELRLCGLEVPLARAGNRFASVARSACEGEGEILVFFSDRPPVSCRIGYVTLGAAQGFRFVVKDGTCQSV
ncbi:MAG: hypothetical protein J7515_01160 [Caulobacter sp.]|nr:hypothetical protein [Caulobacter sp.]